MVLHTHYSTRTLPGRLEGDEQWRETNLGLNPVCYLHCKGQITDFWGLSGEGSLPPRVSVRTTMFTCRSRVSLSLLYVGNLGGWGRESLNTSHLRKEPRVIQCWCWGPREGHEDQAAHFRDEHTRRVVCFPHSPQTCGAPGRPPGGCLLMGEETWGDLRKK